MKRKEKRKKNILEIHWNSDYYKKSWWNDCNDTIKNYQQSLEWVTFIVKKKWVTLYF
jgi:hypothetical protein